MATFDSINNIWTVSAGNNGTFPLYLSGITTNQYTIRYNISNFPSSSDLANLDLMINNIYEPCCINFNTNIVILPSYYNLQLQELLNLDTSSLHLTGQALNFDIASLGRNVKNSDLFYFIKNNLEFNQLIWEFGNDNEPQYVYTSFILNNNQNNVLRLKAKGLNYQNFDLTPILFQGLSN